MCLAVIQATTCNSIKYHSIAVVHGLSTGTQTTCTAVNPKTLAGSKSLRRLKYIKLNKYFKTYTWNYGLYWNGTTKQEFHWKKMYPFREGLGKEFVERNYGSSISKIAIVLTCRPYDFKQRKRYKKAEQRFEYDILLDYYLIKNLPLEPKKQVIKSQFYQLSDKAFEKYKFEDFDKSSFLRDLKSSIDTLEW